MGLCKKTKLRFIIRVASFVDLFFPFALPVVTFRPFRVLDSLLFRYFMLSLKPQLCLIYYRALYWPNIWKLFINTKQWLSWYIYIFTYVSVVVRLCVIWCYGIEL